MKGRVPLNDNGKTVLKKKLNKDQIIIISILSVLTIAAWIYLACSGAGGSMEGMAMDMTGGNDPGMDRQMSERLAVSAYTPDMPSFSMFVPMWIIMCIGMMLPTAVPMFFTFHTISGRRRKLGFPAGPTFAFILGYVVLWGIFGLLCWGAGNIIIQLFGAFITDWPQSMIGVSIIFLMVGVYQLSPLKNACLRGCQHPLQFVLHRWRNGYSGAIRMGMRHGMECVGCCWALMVVMFPLGMMNLFWMGIFTVLMFVEKNAKYGTFVSKVAGAIFLIAGSILFIIGLAGAL